MEIQQQHKHLIHPRHIHFLILAGILIGTVVCINSYGFYDQTIQHDRSFFIYSAQAIHHGLPLYKSTTFFYPPVAPLLSAAAMLVGNRFGLPSYLAVRWAGALVLLCSVAALYFYTWSATRSYLRAALAALILSSFGVFVRISIVNLEAKSLLVLFSILAAIALRKRRWIQAGFWSGLCAMCWQVGALVGLICVGTFLIEEGKKNRKGFFELLAGMFLSSIPVVIYLWIKNDWIDFFRIVLLYLPNSHLKHMKVDNELLSGMLDDFRAEALFLICSATGLVFCLWLWLRHRRLGTLPSFAILSIVIWGLFSLIDFQGSPDVFPLLPWISMAAAWILCRIAFYHRVAAFGALIVLTFTVLYGWYDALVYKYDLTLEHQRNVVHTLTRNGSANFAAFGAQEMYVITDQTSPYRFVRLDGKRGTLLKLLDPRGCDAILERLKSRAPEIIIFRSNKEDDCSQQVLELIKLRPDFIRFEAVKYRSLYKWKVYVDRNSSLIKEIEKMQIFELAPI